jgi:GNAT superfamily N-acetyltransferase
VSFTSHSASPTTGELRRCQEHERPVILTIINAAATAYRGVIPADCWHEPYLSPAELDAEIGAGIDFWGYEVEGLLVGIMGIQSVRDVDLIRHAYVLPHVQGRGVGALLLAHLRRLSTRRMLVGTWADADWAIRFYQRHGFESVSPEHAPAMLRTYWTITERQVETSVVLVAPPLEPIAP